MEFTDIFDLDVKITLAEFISLFLRGDDDKIYIDVMEYGYKGTELYDVRIIDDRLKPFYNREILYISDVADGVICVYLKRDINN